MKKKLVALLLMLVSLSSFSFPTDPPNIIDSSGLKQGLWKLNIPNGYEIGSFRDNLKQGKWLTYEKDGNLLSEKSYNNGKIEGEYIIYYKTGIISETGVWKDDMNIGPLLRCYPNGSMFHQFNFNNKGKRDGKQFYYFNNGQLSIEANFINGVEDGITKRYDMQGNLVGIFVFRNGSLIVKDGKFDIEHYKPDTKADTLKNVSVENLQDFSTASGYNVLYGKEGEILMSGYFRKGRLITGEMYIYDQRGELTDVKKYKRSRFIGLPKISTNKL
jgi:antitoxin component YwqK of YwqJK toxin-antitoxin module